MQIRHFSKQLLPLFWPIVLCLVPFAESLSKETLWGLNWHSPLVMAELGRVLVWVKLIALIASLYLLDKSRPIFASAEDRALLFFCAKVSLMIVSVLQMVLLFLLGVVLQLSSADQFHVEKNLNGVTFYVNNADFGVFASPQQRFYVKCPRALGRYQLKYIQTEASYGDFELSKTNTGIRVDFQVNDLASVELPVELIPNCQD